jgi:hypothetical protein
MQKQSNRKTEREGGRLRVRVRQRYVETERYVREIKRYLREKRERQRDIETERKRDIEILRLRD